MLGLSPLIVFSVLFTILLPGNCSAFNNSDEGIERDRRHDYYGSEPSYFFRASNIHPFLRMNQPLATFAGKTLQINKSSSTLFWELDVQLFGCLADSRNSEGEILDVSTEERARMLNRFRPSIKRVVPVVDSSKPSRFKKKKNSRKNPTKILFLTVLKVTTISYRVASSAGYNRKATRIRKRTATATLRVFSPG
jgi:hypothetical protein